MFKLSGVTVVSRVTRSREDLIFQLKIEFAKFRESALGLRERRGDRSERNGRTGENEEKEKQNEMKVVLSTDCL